MPLQINGVDCSIYLGEDGSQGGISESWTEQGPAQATVHYKCAWANRYQLMQGLKGGTSASGGAIARVIPHQYPDSPNLYCLDIGETRGIKPRAREDGWIEYQYCVFPAVYRVPTWQFEQSSPGSPGADPSGQPWTTTRFRLNGEVISPPSLTYKWIDGPDAGLPLEEGQQGFIKPKIEITMTRHWMPYAPLAWVRDYIGSVNENKIYFSDCEFAPETLMLAGVTSTETCDVLGNLSYDWEYSLLGLGMVDGNVVTWNHLLARDGDYHGISADGTAGGTKPFPKLDFYTALP